MNKKSGKQTWIVPRLEQIEMVDTQTCMGGMSKNNPGTEAGNCGMGVAS